MKSAIKTTVTGVGILMGVAGIEHGIGEILQGSTAPEGLIFPSWPNSPFFQIVGGEPAMSIIPNFLVTGILAVLISLIFLVWVVKFVQRKNGGLILILLSVVLLLFGGGIFPPVMGIILGALGTKINAPLTWWRVHLSVSLQQSLKKIWPWSFTACIIGWLLLFPGINILGYFFGVNDPNLTIVFILFAFVSLLVTIFSGFAYDIQRQTPAMSGK